MPPSATHWNLFIDTGGTFTDCLGVDPAGRTHRCKVLSSSALRGTAAATGNPRKGSIELDYRVCNHFFRGYEFRFLNKPGRKFKITDSEGENFAVTLDSKISLSPGQWSPFEIRSPEEAPLLAARLITNTPLDKPLPPLQMRLSTTKGTNALLERQGAKTLFLITEGYKDLLKIKNQQRPDLFALHIQKQEPFAKYIIEVPERLDANGNVLKELDIEELKHKLESLPPELESAGICLMHSYLNPDHEKQVEELLREIGIPFISRSSDLSAAIKIVPRAVTTDVNSYLAPIMQKYLDRISSVVTGSSLRVMGSSGNLIEANHYKPKDGLLSGPAGGVIGAVAVARRASKKNLQGFLPKGLMIDSDPVLSTKNPGGFSLKIISFDMGGTSTDVSRYDGRLDYIFEHTVGDATLSSPAIEIETVAAGGGSICDFDGKSLTVGPESAGADPGPACYGQEGPLTITDVNLLTGRLDPSNFHITINPKASEEAFVELLEKMQASITPEEIDRNQILEGFLDIANERMAQAIHKISIQKGFDPSDYAMVAFGGAGAQHALAVASKLNINRVLVPSDAGLLSAYGLQQARLEEIASKQVLQPLDEVNQSLSGWFDQLFSEAVRKLKKQGISEDYVEISRKVLFMRLKGQDNSLEIDATDLKGLAERFKHAYHNQYGHWIENREIEVEAIRVIVSEKKSDKAEKKSTPDSTVDKNFSSSKKSTLIYNGKEHSATVYSRDSLQPGMKLKGPALILDPHSTTVIEPGWEGIYLKDGTWRFERIQPAQTKKDYETTKRDLESINLQLFTNRFTSVAEQMGEMLRRTAISVNVKERLDYSCALLDSKGYLVVNAPHIPVHLGAMGTCVRTLIKDLQGFSQRDPYSGKNLGGLDKGLNDGDIVVTNHPGFGGSHLPDVTVVTPVFIDGTRIGFTASRAHHAEMGGKRPGSMPPDANNLAEEGVVIPPTYIAKQGRFDWKPLENLLKNSPWPTRSFEENMADIQAAVSANHRGSEELKKLVSNYGKDEVIHYMQRLKAYAAHRMESTLQNIKDGVYEAAEELDDGSTLCVQCTVNGSSLSIDFEGSSPVHPGNLNANPSIVRSVIMYVLRLLVDEPLPLNDGLLDPVEISIPKGILDPDFPDNPKNCPAVVGGNIETSQRLTDTLLKAFGMAACSYGTMNNVLFGNENFGYYETVAGGTGAGDGFHGAGAVHQHMTNTRAADPEILEHRYPVILNRYEIRAGSGGKGKWNGGDGIIREMTFTEPVSLSVLSQHRKVAPYGLEGGENGKCGKQFVITNKSTLQLSWRDGADLTAGDQFILATPGGGGFGKSDS